MKFEAKQELWLSRTYCTVMEKLDVLTKKFANCVSYKKHMKTLHTVAFILLIIGGLNIGLTAVGYDVLNMILGSIPALSIAVALLIGLSAIFELVTHKNNCESCKA